MQQSHICQALSFIYTVEYWFSNGHDNVLIKESIFFELIGDPSGDYFSIECLPSNGGGMKHGFPEDFS